MHFRRSGLAARYFVLHAVAIERIAKPTVCSSVTRTVAG